MHVLNRINFISLTSIKQPISVMETRCVFFNVGNAFLILSDELHCLVNYLKAYVCVTFPRRERKQTNVKNPFPYLADENVL
jgi:hypothetical protein